MTWVVVAAAAVLVIVLMAATVVASRRTGRWAVVDVTWGLGFVLVAALSALLATVMSDGLLIRRFLLFVLPTIWGLRLASHILVRARGHDEDPRYQKMRDDGASYLRNVLLPQGVAIFFISLPIQIGVGLSRPIGWATYVGIVVWAIGFGFETIGDRQLSAYKADPDKGPVMDRGLWRYTRHPNYFGDATMWWGIWLIAADGGWPGIATVLSPIAMTYFIYAVTGVKLLEKTMMQRPAFQEYAERTSIFFPLPPKKR